MRSRAPVPHRPGFSGRPLVAAAALAFLLLALAPTAQAAAFRIHEPLEVTGALDLGADPARIADSLNLFAAKTAVSGSAHGPILYQPAADAALLVEAPVIRIWDRTDFESLAEGRPAHQGRDATLTATGGAFHYATHAFSIEGTTPFGFSFYTDILGALPDLGPADSRFLEPYEPTLVATTDGGDWTVTSDARDDPDGRQWLLPQSTVGNVRLTVTSSAGSETFEGDRWFVTIRGEQVATFGDGLIAVPMGPDTTVTYGRGPTDAFRAAFTHEGLLGFIDDLRAVSDQVDGTTVPDQQPTESDGDDASGTNPTLAMLGVQPIAPIVSIDDDSAKMGVQPGEGSDEAAPTGDEGGQGFALPFDVGVIADMGDFANGMLLGRVAGTLNIAGEVVEPDDLTIMRFTTLTVDGFTPAQARVQGETPLAFAGGRVQQGNDAAQLGFLNTPTITWVLYVIALVAWVTSRFYRYRDPDQALSNRLRNPARITYWAAVVIGFILFDREVDLLLGTSILSLLFGGMSGVSGGVIGIVVLLQLMLSGAAVAFIGVPIRIIARAGLKVFGFTKATNGFASALAPITGWLFGTRFMLPLLDVLAGSVASSLPA